MTPYTVSGVSATATATSASAGIMKIDIIPSAATAILPGKLYRVALGPGGTSNDEQYAIQIKRQTTAGTWSNAVTPSPTGAGGGTAKTLAATQSTAAGTPDVVLFTDGFHLRFGLKLVLESDAMFELRPVFSDGIIAEFIYAQSNAVLRSTFFFKE